jgi:hypothetical protein
LGHQISTPNWPTAPPPLPETTASSRAIADDLKKQNLFTPPAPRQHPVKEVSGILGDEVLIDNRWYKCDDKIGEATIVHIGPTEVRIAWEGNERTFVPIRNSTRTGASGPKPAALPEKKSPQSAPMVVIDQSREPPWWARIPFQDLSSQEQEKLHKLRERWFDMSEQEQQDGMNALQRRFGK